MKSKSNEFLLKNFSLYIKGEENASGTIKTKNLQ